MRNGNNVILTRVMSVGSGYRAFWRPKPGDKWQRVVNQNGLPISYMTRAYARSAAQLELEEHQNASR